MVGLRIEPEAYKRYRAVAKERGQTFSALTREALDSHTQPKAWGLSDYRSHYEACYMLLREWSHIYGSWLGPKEALTIATQRELSSLPPELSTEAP